LIYVKEGEGISRTVQFSAVNAKKK
jgi:hypothetical protein